LFDEQRIMERRETLLVLPSLKAPMLDDGRIVLTQKFLDGMTEYVRSWDGVVAAIVEPAETASNNLDNVAVAAAALPFVLDVLPFDDERMFGRLAEANVVLGGADYRQNHLAAWCRRVGTPYVMNTEYTLTTRLQIIDAEERNPLRRWRRRYWERNQERAVRRSIAQAAGVQCNGLPTYQAYRELNGRTHLYFDTRVTDAMLPDEHALETRLAAMLGGGPLRLAFSGRLIAMKGADHLPQLANELRALGVPFTLSVFGAGDLEPSIRIALSHADQAGAVQLKGTADFKTELMPYFQEAVDLFVCPHRQGDPSCTYLETLSCGVPIVGYANEAWRGLLSVADVGRSVTMNDVSLLARAIVRLHVDRETLARLSLQAWEFAKSHTFEQTFAGRIAHLRQCASLPTAATALG
jgi:glycosyltransferase involved in cell wall biosynthesis